MTTEFSDLDSNINAATLLQAIINAIPAPIFFKDATGRYLGCNGAFEEFVGRSSDELVGKEVFELWDRELAQVYYEADKALFDRGGKQIYEANVKYADGSIRDIVFHKAVFEVENGESGIVGVMLDITDRKNAEAELAKRNEILSHTLRELGKAVNENEELKKREKENIFRATVHSTQHILNNLLNQLTLVKLEIDKCPTFNDKTRKQFAAMTKEASELLEKLSSVEEIEAQKIKDSVSPK